MISAMKLAFIRYMSIVISTIIFCHQNGTFLVICIIVTCLHLRFALLEMTNGQPEP